MAVWEVFVIWLIEDLVIIIIIIVIIIIIIIVIIISYFYYIISKGDNSLLRGSIDAYIKHELNHDEKSGLPCPGNFPFE